MKFKHVILGLCLYSACSFAKTSIVTFNIANYDDHPNWDKRIHLIVDAIETAQADIVVLQEVRFNPDEKSSQTSYQNSAEQILAELNQRGDFLKAQLVTQPLMFYPNSANYPLPGVLSPTKKPYVWEGLSIISKKPILETGTAFLSQPAQCTDFNKRGTQYVKVKTDMSAFYIVNVHFAFTDDCINSNVSETLSYINKFDPDLPLVMVGDMNIEPSHSALSAIRAAGFTDMWALLQPGDAGYTYPSNKPVKRIDYIWGNNKLAANLTKTGQVMQLGQTPNADGVFASDHLGLALVLP